MSEIGGRKETGDATRDGVDTSASGKGSPASKDISPVGRAAIQGKSPEPSPAAPPPSELLPAPAAAPNKAPDMSSAEKAQQPTASEILTPTGIAAIQGKSAPQ